MADFTHFNASGEAHMVDVGDKPPSKRLAIAEGRIRLQPETLEMIVQGRHKKGDVLGVARIAGIMAAKKTADLVPLCHPLALTRVSIDLTTDPEQSSILCVSQVETRGPTGVEMEALCAVQITLLTIYDMCKAVDRGMTFTDIGLRKKSGGRSGEWESNH
ncbi:MAG: cyclic pyranopterin monophosphate synthase MoaC [Candidatus Thiodiazotropha sp.]